MGLGKKTWKLGGGGKGGREDRLKEKGKGGRIANQKGRQAIELGELRVTTSRKRKGITDVGGGGRRFLKGGGEGETPLFCLEKGQEFCGTSRRQGEGGGLFLGCGERGGGKVCRLFGCQNFFAQGNGGGEGCGLIGKEESRRN